MKKIMVFGAFDGLHTGHLDFFKQAKKYGNFLIVSVGTDANVAKFKGKKPLFSQKERLKLVSSLKIVDQAVLGAKKDFYSHIKKFQPDIILLGFDQWAGVADVRRELKKVGLTKTQVLRARPYQKEKAKSKIMKSKSVEFDTGKKFW